MSIEGVKTRGVVSESADAGKPAPIDSKRNKPRRRILKGGIIAYSSRHLTVECAVRDLSDDGARLIVTNHRQIPDSFELLIELDGFEANCEVVWRRPESIGVRFLAPPRRVEPRRQQVLGMIAPRPQSSLRRRPPTA